MRIAAGETGSITLAAFHPAPQIAHGTRALARGRMPWWIVPLLLGAAATGVFMQTFIAYLWIVGKGHLH